MNSNNALNVSCEFNGYLVCQMPAKMVEMELKIKTKRGKYTLHKDTNTRTERYCPWERADKKSKNPHQEKDKIGRVRGNK